LTAPGDTVALDGEVNIYRAAEVRELLLTRIAAGAHRIDLSRVQEVDSSGVQLLVAARRSIEAAGGVAEFVAPSQAVVEACAILGLNVDLSPIRGGAR